MLVSYILEIYLQITAGHGATSFANNNFHFIGKKFFLN